MTSRPTALEPHWRIAWAERENQRRRRAYRSATDAWLRRKDHLTRLRIEAVGFLGCTQPRTGLPVDLADNELVFRVLPNAELVEAEARHVVGLPTPGPLTCADTPDGALPAGLRALDAGMAVVTNHRVAFAGHDHRREWRYADLSAPAHHPDVPLTLLHTTDRGPLAGLLVPASAAVNARFYLTLAIAAAAGERAAVATQLDALLDAHQGARPTPPPLVEPDEAPLTALRPDRRALAVAAVGVVVFSTLGPGALGPEQAGPVQRREAAVIVATDAPADGDAVAPVLPIGPVAPERSRTGPVGRATRAPTTGATPYGPSTTGTPVPPAVSASPTAEGRPTASVPSASSVPTPGPAPTTDPPPVGRPALPTASATPTAPAPTTATPSPDPALITLCLDPLQLPLVHRLLCPPTEP
ncbi:hypothetical protein [Micromonospora sp. NBC_00858]|uniref:hypothetical protein n=1 Tax=Micromonospora sp. NBC_00858 TaxID=2975979 RepID=UPI00386BA546|nr:hypothetical protein OG990_23995 [Micromonospora sp. NBC_00858]